MAVSTCEIFTLPDEQAAPALTEIAGEVERHDLRLRRNAGQGDAAGIGQARRVSAEDAPHRGAAVLMRASQIVAQIGKRGQCFRQVAQRDCRGGTEAGDPGEVFRAGALAALLPAAAKLRGPAPRHRA